MNTRWIVFLRAVNVGGTGKLPMAELRRILAEDGAQNVATYIQSGNIALTCEEDAARAVEDRLKGLIAAYFGLSPGVMAFTVPQIDAALDANPFPAPAEPSRVHFGFFTGQPVAEALARLAPFCMAGEELAMGEHCLYLHTPEGMGRSRLSGQIEKALGCPATLRNLNTVRRVRGLA